MKKIILIIFTLSVFSQFALSAMGDDAQVKSFRESLAGVRSHAEMALYLLSTVKPSPKTKKIQRKSSQMAVDCFDNEISRLAPGFDDFTGSIAQEKARKIERKRDRELAKEAAVLCTIL